MSTTELQPLLDQCAKIIGGGPTGGDRAGLYRGAGGIAGVKAAYSTPPDLGSLAVDGVFCICVHRGTETVTGDAGDLTTYRHRLGLQLLVALGRSDALAAHRILSPFVDALYDTFKSKTHLNDGVNNLATAGCFLKGVLGIDQTTPLAPDRFAIEGELVAEVEKSITYSG